jgi:inosine/xanthosine triphosphate pyrophosphatase family protein
MLTLVTSNPAKYAPFARELEHLRIALERPRQPLAELQCLNFSEALAEKARTAAAMFGRPVLVDDAGLALEAYGGFPGPLTSTVLGSLGVAGLERLLTGTSSRAAMECHLGCWVNGSLRRWTGSVSGRLDFARPVHDPRMALSDLFVPDTPNEDGQLLHRARALAALEADAFELHIETAPSAGSCEAPTSNRPNHECPFCAEFDSDGLSIFAGMMGNRLPSRIVYEDEDFVVMPPLGEFMEGGLLLLTRRHILSLAYLPPEVFHRLERVLVAIREAVRARWGVAPLVFEHGPPPEWSKGVCCVDHAHLNIFPAAVKVEPHLTDRMSLPLGSLEELARLQRAEFGYLLVQENDGTRRVYDGQNVPTQLVRRIITTQLGMPDRWHWRDYPGQEELLATYHALKGQIHP